MLARDEIMDIKQLLDKVKSTKRQVTFLLRNTAMRHYGRKIKF